MDALEPEALRRVVRRVLGEYAAIPYAIGDLRCEAAFDDERGRYLLLTVGWDGGRRVHGCLVHVDLIGDKIRIERDGTERGIAAELVADGVPPGQIVLAFQPESRRAFSGFATA